MPRVRRLINAPAGRNAPVSRLHAEVRLRRMPLATAESGIDQLDQRGGSTPFGELDQRRRHGHNHSPVRAEPRARIAKVVADDHDKGVARALGRGAQRKDHPVR
eukprot:2537301-Prymnesium_polylepis.2